MARLVQSRHYWKAGQAILPLFVSVTLLGQFMGHFALAQASLAQETLNTATAPTSSPATPTPELTGSPTPTPTLLSLPATPTSEMVSEPAPLPLSIEEQDFLLRQAAEKTFAGRLLPGQVFEVGLTKIVAEWAFVNFRLKTAESTAEPGWEVYVGLAHWDGLDWTVMLEDSPDFLIWLDQIPTELIPDEARLYLKPTGAMAANAPGLWLPFPVGQTWKYLAGPNGGPRREAVDFGPFSLGETPSPSPVSPLTGRERDVTAAATGLVIDRDANLLILRHGSHPTWETGYYSLAADSNINQVGQLIYQGERIGAASAESDPTKGVHVHFWVRQAGVNQAIAGQLLSEWQIYQDNSFDVGQNKGRIVYKSGDEEKIDCPTVERFALESSFCHVHHTSITPAPLPVSTISFSPTISIPIEIGSSKSITVQVDSAADLYGVKLRATYTPTTPVTVIDAWPDTPGIEVAPGSIFSNVPMMIIQNTVDPTTGVIEFQASRQVPAPAFTGLGSLIVLTLHREVAGPAVILNLDSIQLTDSNGRTLPITPTTSAIQIQAGFVIEGQVELQGRKQSSGVTVTTSGRQTQTDSPGHFKIGAAGTYRLTVTHSGYLSAQAEGDPLASALPDGATINLGRITLRAGEVTGDDQINILDLAFIARYYGQSNLMADINSDGIVNIYDLAMAAANYGQRGPITAWQ